MNSSQPGVFAVSSKFHCHLEFDVTNASSLLDAVCEVKKLATTVNGMNVVVGFAPSVWASIAPNAVLEGFSDFTAFEGKATIPATQAGLWVWLHGATEEDVAVAARQATKALGECASLVHEQATFVNGRSRDLTGYEDGTDNRPVDSVPGVIRVPQGPAEGGSVAVVMRWEYALEKFQAKSEAEQDLVFGRRKESNESIPREERHERTHRSLVSVHDADGEELEMFRRGSVFSGEDVQGQMFIGFSQDVDRLDRMLQNMVDTPDFLFDHATAVRSAYYFVPPVDALA